MDSSGVGPPSLPSRGEAARASAVVLGKLFGETVEIAGRYRLGEQIGRGGLGFVHRARDLKLDRDVALKFPRGATANPEIVADLEREAKVLARLQHPNIVAVYDVGESDQGVYLAMELIDGVSMSEWLSEGERTWQEVVEVMRAAGQGLAAAHEAGVVHRDFKPSNVMIDRAGRVRVVDLGLAREVGMPTDAPTDPDAAVFETKAAGTPPYMAPEQFDGQVSAASDQFAFCTALFEGICGKRPWSTRQRGVGSAEERDRLARALRNGGAPRRVRRTVLRGVACDPAERFPSMATVHSALAPAPRGRAVSVLAVGALAGVVFGARAFEPDPCTLPTDLDAVWTADARQYVETTLGPGGGLEAVDAAVESWTEESHANCVALQAEQVSPLLFELRARCLDRKVGSLDYALSSFEEQPVDPARFADTLIRSLEPGVCRDDDVLLLWGGGTEGNPTDVRVSEEIDRAVGRAYVQLNLGRDAKFFEILEDAYQSYGARTEAGAAGASLAAQYGVALVRRGAVADAETVMRDALLRYTADPRVVLYVAQLRAGLAVALSTNRARALEAKHLAEDALMVMGKRGLSPQMVPALTARARAAAQLGELDAARESLEQLDALVDEFDEERWSGYERNRLELKTLGADVRVAMGDTEVAERSYEAAIREIRESDNAPRLLAQSLNNLAELRARTDPSRATAELAEEAASLKAEVGDRVGAAQSWINAGTVHWAGGRLGEAARAYEAGLAVAPEHEHAVRLELLFNLGIALVSEEEYQSAERVLLRARRRAVEAQQGEGELRFGVETMLLQIAVARGRLDDARKQLVAVRALQRPEFAAYTRVEVEVAACEIERGDAPERARESISRARRMLRKLDAEELSAGVDRCEEALASAKSR